MAAPPKLFISYSWTSDDHQQWVIGLANSLTEAGVDVVLDKWALREGHDAHQFMEQMVADPNIRKVILICDRQYAEKTNNRAGGVGTEAQIISAEVYAKQDQDKFVAVIVERDESGKPFLPIYYRSRIYIDLSSDEQYARNFEQLLRWIYDKPLYIKPPLGERPAFLSDDAKAPLGTTALALRALDAVRGKKNYRQGACSEYLDRLFTGMETLRISGGEQDFDDRVVKSIDEFLPYRNEAISLFLALATNEPISDEVRALHRFFERTYSLMHRPENVGSYFEWDYDNFRFIAHELLLYLVATFLRQERFEAAGELLRQPYYVGRDPDSGDGTVSFARLRSHMKSLDHRNQRLNLRRLSLRADLLNSRASASGVPFDYVMQADFVLYIRDALDALRYDQSQRWWPDTLLYARHGHRAFEIFARAQSVQYFERVRGVFDIRTKADFEPVFQAMREQRLRIPRWEFESFNPTAMLGYDRLATRP